MSEKQQLLVATGNRGKLTELQSKLASAGYSRLLCLADYQLPSPEETASTFGGNATIKARSAGDATGLVTLGDDSGLVVPALSGEPGIYSARYAGPNATDCDNLNKLLRNLESAGISDRSAYFVCSLVLYAPKIDLILEVQAEWHGEITRTPKGDNGFGYDPIFMPSNFKVTAAELDRSEKNQISHRGQALDQLVALMQSHSDQLAQNNLGNG